MAAPALVLFDLDGTLLDERALPAALRATCRAVADAYPGRDVDAMVAANTAVWQRIWPEVEDDWMLGGAAGSELSALAWRETLETCGIEDGAALHLALEVWELQERGAHALFPEVPAMLDAFAAAGVPVGVVSNGASSVQRGKLRALGIEGRFDPIVISSEIGVAKPDPAAFEHAVAMAEVDPALTWFVGDNLRTDVLGAARAGLRTVWVDREGRGLPTDQPQLEPAADLTLPDLHLPDLALLPARLLATRQVLGHPLR